ncbi:hypothetical protein SCHPADRAFT_937952 [Schizopora paradoxa]|uniref:Sjogrens syndrome scleroderma autoantigen 1 family protein n=1 Tax=Schizopora paradoxa TaxID=27342 RepID=A0A0H2RXI6_9AGAM|nr:hypothetical protein SCHPADRAFT_937952 [Schizopora paradoxa]
MASIILDVSSKLGEYMLKGWVLTDETCHNEKCHVPLLRSPKGQNPEVYFCANCDEEPMKVASGSGSRTAPPRSGQASPPPRQSSPSEALSISSPELQSRSSTPDTDIPSSLNSPTFVPPPPSAETLRRRQQSDAAAAEIGSRLLKGWAMLADECPNPSCFGIPLVRRPQTEADRGQNEKKECVVCGIMYIDEGHGLVASGSNANALAMDFPTHGDSDIGSTSQSDAKQTQRASSINQESPETLPTSVALQSRSSFASLDSAATSLDITLQSLSKKLSNQSKNPDEMDLMSIGNTVDGIEKVLSTMERLQKLRSSSGP